MIDLDFGQETTARAHVSQLDKAILSNPEKMQEIQNTTGLTKEEIIGLIYEKKSKRVHISMKPTLFDMIESYASKEQMTVTSFLTELAIQEIFKNR